MSCSLTESHFSDLIQSYPRCTTPSTHYSLPIPQSPVSGLPNTVNVFESDTFNVAERMVKEEKLNPLVLNMASDMKAGGGWRKGAMAQEECLFYRSTYSLTLDPQSGYSRSYSYPIGNKCVIYSPCVRVFLDENQRPLNRPFDVACIAVPFVRNPVTVNGRLNAVDELITEQKINAIVELAVRHGHDSLLLSAGGCGVFNNPPHQIAEIFARVLQQRPCGLHVVFAILSVRDRTNFLAFQKQFM